MEHIESKVLGPAIGLMVTAGVGIAFQLLSLVMHLFSSGLQVSAGGEAAILGLLSGGMSMVLSAIAILVGGAIIFGAMKMKRLESYGLAMACSVLAALPCTSPCCLLGLPIGIWSVVVLLDDEVKGAFR